MIICIRGGSKIKSYKVETCKVMEAEELMNSLARAGSRVISIMTNNAVGSGMVVIFENTDYVK